KITIPPLIPPSNNSMIIQSKIGSVTQTEIDLFISFLEQPSRIPKTALDNLIADGQAGQDVEALGLVYEPDNKTISGYAGSEGLDTIGHIAYTAYHILKTPCLWDENVTDNDPHEYGTTYKE
ncbi:17647_t:CDS:2, partial [Racocetra fulgida]